MSICLTPSAPSIPHQVMGGLERQVADYHEREEEVQRLARESKQKVEDALSLKDQVP
jgi:hypothetical protein